MRFGRQGWDAFSKMFPLPSKVGMAVLTSTTELQMWPRGANDPSAEAFVQSSELVTVR